jgi:hypothetical protein
MRVWEAHLHLVVKELRCLCVTSLSNAVLVCFKLCYLPRYVNVLPLFRIEFIKRFSSHFSYRSIYD